MAKAGESSTRTRVRHAVTDGALKDLGQADQAKSHLKEAGEKVKDVFKKD